MAKKQKLEIAICDFKLGRGTKQTIRFYSEWHCNVK
jgi:hypothetical protein